MPRLSALAVSAENLGRSISDAAEGLQHARTAADTSIDVQVESLNRTLKEVQKLNTRITIASAGGMSPASLMDQRSELIDQINEMIPVNVVERDGGQVALFSEGGIILLDGQAAELEFSSVKLAMPNMTQANGLLSGLTVNGIAIDTRANGPLGSGTLAAQFEIRDVLSVEAQQDLDAMAMDLIQRFQDPSLDATLGATDPGLFTDNQAFFDPSNLTGIANRIELHDSVSMTGAAETWRLRDGLNAAAPGDAGDASLLRSYTVALEASRTVTSPGLGTSDMNATTLSASLLSRFAQDKVAADQALTFASMSFSEAEQLELAQGVDSDYELQNLMIIEQAFAANAKMMTAVDEMMQELLRI
jgi:flagellar hook-associated protein 1 FlgK